MNVISQIFSKPWLCIVKKNTGFGIVQNWGSFESFYHWLGSFEHFPHPNGDKRHTIFKMIGIFLLGPCSWSQVLLMGRTISLPLSACRRYEREPGEHFPGLYLHRPIVSTCLHAWTVWLDEGPFLEKYNILLLWSIGKKEHERAHVTWDLITTN